MAGVPSYYPFLALLLIDGIGNRSVSKLPMTHEEIFRHLQTAVGRRRLSDLLEREISTVPWDQFDRQLEAIERHRVTVLALGTLEYPRYLEEIAESPTLLFCRGKTSVLDGRGVGIVGTRNASARGCAFAASLAGDLVDRGVMVVSGAARGIDSAAHRGALERKGVTVAVVGTGVDLTFPPENRELIEAVHQSGCVVSEQLMGTPALAHVFPRRNRLISALSRLVVVVEAGGRSGALLTARWALEQGRDVGAVPGFPGDFRSRGGNRLLKSGAAVIEGVDDVLRAAPLLAHPVRRSDRRRADEQKRGIPVGLGAKAREVLEALGSSPSDPDAVARHLGRPVEWVQRRLTELELSGLVDRDPAGGYSACARGREGEDPECKDERG